VGAPASVGRGGVGGTLGLLAEPARVRILRIQDGGELSVGEIAAVVQLPQSTVSRHLKVLTEAGWLSRRNVGTATLYQFAMDNLSSISRTLWVTVREQLEEEGGAELREDSRRLKDVLAQRRLDSEAFFGRVAGEWDAVRGRLFGAGFTARSLLGLIPRSWVVADLGCGTGNASELLAPLVHRVVAVDKSGPMLEAAAKRLGLAGAGNVEFREGSLEALPLRDRSVDAAAAVLVLHHVQDAGRALVEMRRVLRASRGGGVGLVVDMVEHDREEYRRTMGHIHLGFAPEGVAKMMRAAGFAAARADLLPADPEARGPGLFVAVGRV
jgi:SAM-dependent methyltransferase